MRRKTGISLFMVALLLLVQVVTVEAAANPNPSVAPINSSAYGKTYAQWSVAWWQWLYSLNSTTNPFTAQDCATIPQPANQKVFFLVGTAGGSGGPRTCTISTGTPLFFPIINLASLDYYPTGIDDPPGDNPTTWLRYLKIYFESGNVKLSATLDGKPLQDLTNYQVFSDKFFSYLVPDNLYGYPAGKVLAINGGYYLMLHPLSAGSHTLSFSGETLKTVADADPNIFYATPFSVSTTYQLTVTNK